MAPTAEACIHGAPSDVTSMLAPADDSGSFSTLLERPTKIYSATWSAGSFSATQIDPWQLFLNDPMVKSVIYRYKALTGDLSLRIQINGTPFHFGLLLAAYQPSIRSSDVIPTTADVRALTTCPHVMIDPSTSNEGVFTCPMATPYNYIDLTQDKPSLGVLTLASLVDLQSSSGTVDAITINIYAHMNDPALSLPVVHNTERTYFPQMGNSDEEVEASTKGFISGPLRIASRWAGYLSDVPTIGPFATAASTFTGAAADFAKFFGYSRPRDLKVPSKMVKHVAGNLASADAVDTSSTLAVNSSSQLSIDPRIMGVANGLDELAISAIAGKWGLIDTIDWTVGSSPNTALFQAGVSPSMGIDLTTATDAQYPFVTPIAFASLPFQYWTGTIEVKIQVVCSRYHRGRLRVQWHPQQGFADTTSMNTSFNQVIEISDSVDHIFQIPYAQPEGYGRSLATGVPFDFSENGDLRILVQNELTSPEATSPATILIWVRAGSDFKLAAPGSWIGHTSPYRPEMGDPEQSDHTNDPVVHTFFEHKPKAEYNDIFMADPVLSFRTLLKRYTHFATLQPLNEATSAGGENVTTWIMPMYPAVPGIPEYTAGWADISTGGASGVMNYNSNTLYAYLSSAFLAKRGGFRWKVETIGNTDDGTGTALVWREPDATVIQCYNDNYSSSSFYVMDTENGVSGPARGVGTLGSTALELQYHDTSTNKAMEIEVPFYSQYKFVTEPHEYATDHGVWPEHGFGVQLRTRVPNGVTNYAIGSTGIRTFCAASEDFTMGVWRGIKPPYRVAVTTPKTQRWFTGYAV